MADSHTDGGRVEPNFCSKRAEGACPCGNNYKTPCKGEMKAWSASVAAQGLAANAWKYLKLVGSSGRLQRWGGQAHHALCIASVTGQITTVVELESTLKVTKWCVNKADNMIALPMWPMTICWYGTFAKNAADEVNWIAKAKAQTAGPPFAGLAQHDYDHGLYNDQVDKALTKIANAAKRSKKKHEETAADLLGALEAERGKFRAKLTGRATHDAWFKGMADDADWWHAFSMVGKAGSTRAFPAPADPKWFEAFEGLLKAFTHHLG